MKAIVIPREGFRLKALTRNPLRLHVLNSDDFVEQAGENGRAMSAKFI